MSSLLFTAKSDPGFQSFIFIYPPQLPPLHQMVALLISQNLFFFGYHTGKFKLNDDITKQALSSIIEIRVSDTVKEFKKFNKSLFLRLPCVINHMAAL